MLHSDCSGTGCRICARLKQCGQQCNQACRVTDCINGEVLFVKKADSRSCSLFTVFGNDGICGCPIRKEIYLREGR
jgi:hypothetical protein